MDDDRQQESKRLVSNVYALSSLGYSFSQMDGRQNFNKRLSYCRETRTTLCISWNAVLLLYK